VPAGAAAVVFLASDFSLPAAHAKAALMLRRALVLTLAAAALAACPQERPGAEKQIPHERVPPAVSIETLPADAGSGGSATPASVRRP
jgi:hypothetical protein